MVNAVYNESMPATLTLYRGLPGSGKTTAALKRVPPDCAVSADDFMVDDDGHYAFNARKLGYCHAKCQVRVTTLMMAETPHIAVHNTFSQQWEAEPYYQMAREHGYKIEVVECKGRFGSVHGVPAATVAAMEARWQALEVPEDLRV